MGEWSFHFPSLLKEKDVNPVYIMMDVDNSEGVNGYKLLTDMQFIF
jgi:hypothetical protein